MVAALGMACERVNYPDREGFRVQADVGLGYFRISVAESRSKSWRITPNDGFLARGIRISNGSNGGALRLVARLAAAADAPYRFQGPIHTGR